MTQKGTTSNTNAHAKSSPSLLQSQAQANANTYLEMGGKENVLDAVQNIISKEKLLLEYQLVEKEEKI